MNEFDTLLSELKDVLLDLTSHELTPKGVNSAIVKEEVVVESPELTTQPHFVEEEVEKIPIVNAVFFYPYKNDLVDEFVSKLNEQIKSTARKQFIINVIKKYEYLDDSFIFSKLEEVKNIAPRVVFVIYEYLTEQEKIEMAFLKSDVEFFSVNVADINKKTTYLDLVISLGFLAGKV